MNDFFITAVTGEQTPYDSERIDAIRQAQSLQQLQQLNEARLAEGLEAAKLESTQASQGASSARATESTAAPAQTEQSSAAVGTAGASVLTRTSAEQGVSPATDPNRLPEPPLPDQKKNVFEGDELRPMKAVASDTLHQEHLEVKPNKLPKAYARLGNEQVHRQEAVLAEQIMTSPVVTLPATATLSEALELIRKEKFRHVPVITESNRLIGILSDRSFIAQAEKLDPKELKIRVVKDLMATNVLTARPATEIRDVARVMFEERIGALPIVSEKSELLGILTRSDLLRVMINRAPLELWL